MPKELPPAVPEARAGGPHPGGEAQLPPHQGGRARRSALGEGLRG